MVKYDRFWETLKKKGTSQYSLIKRYGISAGQLGRIKKNMHVSTHTLEVLCSILECPVQEIIEIIPESVEPKIPLPNKTTQEKKKI